MEDVADVSEATSGEIELSPAKKALESTLVGEMGFEADKVRAILLTASDSMNLDQALGALVNQAGGEDPPSQPSSSSVAVKSFKCVETGKLFKTRLDVELYAERTGRANFEESTEEVPDLTPEEKATRIEKVKELIVKRKAEKEEEQKKLDRQNELARRKGGQEMGDIREEQARLQRMRDAEALKKEKKEAAAHRERLRMEVAKDKAERAADRAEREGRDRKRAYDESMANSVKSFGTDKKAELATDPDACIALISAYKQNDVGFKCLKALRSVIGKIRQNPSDVSKRRLNADNPAVKRKILKCLGAKDLLKQAGFVEVNDVAAETHHLVLEEVDDAKLAAIESKLSAAL